MSGHFIRAADVPVATPEECRALERAYRRAYRDGWIAAMDAFYDRIPSLGRDSAYNALWDFWLDTLCAWAVSDCTVRILPPGITPPSSNPRPEYP